jgi:hypothetical protein
MSAAAAGEGTVTARGSLGTPGQQRSAGFSTVMVINVIAVAAIVAVCVALALT